MKLILIDGNNLAMRQAHAYNLSVYRPIEGDHPDDFDAPANQFPTGILHGFLKTLAILRNRFPGRYLTVVWDGGYQHRTTLSKQAVAQRIVPEEYKENRRRKAPSPEILNWLRQKPVLMNALRLTNIPQVLVDGEEADDVIASYVAHYAKVAENFLLFTTDKDYFQLLGPQVRMLRGEGIYDEADFRKEYGVSPAQWLDVAGLEGDNGDNIFGAPGWGEVSAVKAIQSYGSLEDVLANIHIRLDPLRQQYPDLTDVQPLADLKTPSGKAKFPGVYASMPFTGVAWAMEQSRKVKASRLELSAMMHEPRSRLAKVLKTMRRFPVADLPGWNQSPAWNRQKQSEFFKFCQDYSLREVSEEASLLCAPQSRETVPDSLPMGCVNV